VTGKYLKILNSWIKSNISN